MAGTIIITGANGSLAIPAVEYLLTKYPDYTVVLTVRNSEDANTKRLKNVIARHPSQKTSVRQLDLANLTAVHDFAGAIAAEISEKRLPRLSSIVCNAYYWNLTTDGELTQDGYEKTMQVNHIANVALVMRLLGSFAPAPSAARVVLLSSDAHWPGKAVFEKYPPSIPDNIDELVKAEANSDKFGRGFLRYATSKLALTMWMYALNRRLEKDPALSHITAIAMHPGDLCDSRALRVNTPLTMAYLSRFIIHPLRPLLRLSHPNARTSADAGVDVIELATTSAAPNDRGFFTLVKKDVSSPESNDVEKQENIWKKSAEWAKITSQNTVLAGAFE